MKSAQPFSRSDPPFDVLSNASLFLDFDGTLVEIAERPDAVCVDRRLVDLMQGLLDRLDGRVALISGRPAAQVRALFSMPIAIVGSHGMEFEYGDGRTSSTVRPEGLTEALATMQRLAARRAGLLVEDKPMGVALHFRQRPEAEADCVGLATKLAETHGLHLQTGKMMIEVRAAGGDKGSAIRTLMRKPDMAATRPIFVGDDQTDEPGFVAALELGGAGILVGAARPTAAQYRLPSVEAALAWLEKASVEAT